MCRNGFIYSEPNDRQANKQNMRNFKQKNKSTETENT